MRVAAAIVTRKKRVLVVREPDDAQRWAGLWVFPHAALEQDERPELGARRAAKEHGVRARITGRLTTLRYTITRFRMTLEVFGALAEGSAAGRYVRVSELDSLAMPAPHRKLARTLQASAQGGTT